jgi:hypothetical protein
VSKENNPEIDPGSSLRVAESLIDEGDALLGSHQREDALVVYERVLEQFGEAQEGDLGRQIRTALAKKGAVLVTLDCLDEADRAFDELCARTRHASDPDRALAHAQEMIARIFYKRARTLLKEKRYEDTVATVNTLLVS